MAAGIPLVESGTAGYLGQVQPLLKVRPSPEAPNSAHLGTRIAPSVSTVYRSQPQSHFLFALSDRPLRNLFTVLSGPRVISFRESMSRQTTHFTDLSLVGNYSEKMKTAVPS